MGTVARGAKSGGGQNFNAGQVIDPAEVNQDFNTLYSEVNGLLDDTNLETGTLPGAKSLRFTEISTPSSPASNDLLLYANDDGSGVTRLYSKDAAGIGRWVGGVERLYFTLTTNGTPATTTLTVLQAYTLPAGLLKQAGDLVRLRAWGTFAANGNTKTVTMFFGASVLTGVAGAFNNVTWRMEAEILYVGAAQQYAFGTTWVAPSTIDNRVSVPAETAANAIGVSVYGQNGTASANDIICSFFRCEFIPNALRF